MTRLITLSWGFLLILGPERARGRIRWGVAPNLTGWAFEIGNALNVVSIPRCYAVACQKRNISPAHVSGRSTMTKAARRAYRRRYKRYESIGFKKETATPGILANRNHCAHYSHSSDTPLPWHPPVFV